MEVSLPNLAETIAILAPRFPAWAQLARESAECEITTLELTVTGPLAVVARLHQQLLAQCFPDKPYPTDSLIPSQVELIIGRYSGSVFETTRRVACAHERQPIGTESGNQYNKLGELILEKFRLQRARLTANST